MTLFFFLTTIKGVKTQRSRPNTNTKFGFFRIPYLYFTAQLKFSDMHSFGSQCCSEDWIHFLYLLPIFSQSCQLIFIRFVKLLLNLDSIIDIFGEKVS